MTFEFAVCDDRNEDADYIAQLAQEWARQSGTFIHIEKFPSAEAFLFRYEEMKAYDILLLDIEMSYMNGVELAKRIRSNNEVVQIIFVTGYTDYIAEGYEVSALHYLVKPVEKEKLFQTLDRAIDKLKKNEKVIHLEISGEILCLPMYEIRYVEVQQNYVTYHAKQDYTQKATLSTVEKELDERFYRIGRSYIVNLTSIRKVTRTEIVLNDDIRIPLPRGQYEALNRVIIERM